MEQETRFEIRREVREGDPDAIVELHERVYKPEHGMGDSFVEGVRGTVVAAVETGWPVGGGAWLVDGPDGRLAGSLGLTDEGGGLGNLRWVVLVSEARGLGLGRRMITDAVDEARRLGFERLELRTFGALETAGGIYRSLGFEILSVEETEMWGPRIAYQHYALEL